MSIRKKLTRKGEPRWLVEWRLPDRRKVAKSFRTEREARVFEAEVVAARSRGIVYNPRLGDSITVAYAYKSWLSTRQDVTPKTRRGNEDNWRSHIEPVFGAWPVTKVDRSSVQNWINAMTVGPRTMRWRHTVLRMVLDHAVDEGWLARNPAVKTVFPPLAHPAHSYLTALEVERLAKLCGPQGDIVMTLAYTGLRWGELTGLNVEDIDLNRRRIHVRRSMTQVGGKLVTGATKSRAGQRSIPIPDTVRELLRARIAGRGKTDAAVCSPKGARLSRENWVRSVEWKKKAAELGQPSLRIHDLRHTYASLARSAGADMRLLQKTMGHSSITVTAHTYADLYDDELDSVADALDSLSARLVPDADPTSSDGRPVVD